MKKINRKCVVCGRTLQILLDPRNRYKGGHYFGRMKIYKKHKETGKYSVFGKIKFPIVKGIGKSKEFEYWECEKCYKE